MTEYARDVPAERL